MEAVSAAFEVCQTRATILRRLGCGEGGGGGGGSGWRTDKTIAAVELKGVVIVEGIPTACVATDCGWRTNMRGRGKRVDRFQGEEGKGCIDT